MLPPNPRLSTGIVIVINLERELILGIVLSCQVAQNGISFKDSEIIVVMVDEHGDTTIWINGSEPRLLLDLITDVDALDGVFHSICITELFEKDLGFETVRCAPAEELNAFGGDEAGWSSH
ncbi:hypothetical protein HG530_009822 [Fusarium avenaceum]|nr:hypothetical protein HG530_009822 [Fusarium avenaceum]